MCYNMYKVNFAYEGSYNSRARGLCLRNFISYYIVTVSES